MINVKNISTLKDLIALKYEASNSLNHIDFMCMLKHNIFMLFVYITYDSFYVGTSHGYHAFSFGLYIDQLIRRVDPQQRDIQQFFQEEVAQPFGNCIVYVVLWLTTFCHWKGSRLIQYDCLPTLVTRLEMELLFKDFIYLIYL